MNGKRILILIEHLNGGGAERVAAELSLSLEKRGHDVSLVCFEDRGTSYRHCKNCCSLDLPGSSSYLRKAVNLIRRIYRIRRMKRDRRIEATVSFIENANLVNVLSKQNDRTICSIRTVLSNVSKRPFRRILQQLTLQRADCVVTLSEYVRQDLIDHFSLRPEHVRTIYNPCNLPVAAPVPTEKDRPFTVITAGRLVNAKGQWHLIRAFSAFHRKHPDTRLIILGLGPLSEQLKELARAVELETAVAFPGFVESPEKAFANADVFAFTSLWEGFGNAIVEAMACGLPVICANCPGGPKEILCGQDAPMMNEDGVYLAEYGILISKFEEDDFRIDPSAPLGRSELALEKSMEMLFLSDALRNRLKRASLERALFFDPETIVNEWEHTFD